MKQRSRLIQKSRLDALVDGVFAVALTLLVIDLKLPDGFHPAATADLLRGLADLETQFLVYVVSFLVLGLRWMSLAKLSGPHETVEDSYVLWSLVHLFLITCIPFSTMVVGRYGTFAPAIWLYAGNTILAALVAARMTTLAGAHIGDEDARDRRTGLIVVIAVSLLVVAFSLIQTRHAMALYLLNAFAPVLRYRRPAPK